MVDMAHIAGLVAAGCHPSPIPYADYVTTTTHKTLRGPRGGMILCRQEHAKTLNSRVFPGMQGGPLMHVIAAKAVALKEASTPEFTDYQRQIVTNAKALAGALTDGGFRLVSGGTDNHLMLMDLRDSELTGKLAQDTLERAGITANRNTVPFDTRSPVRDQRGPRRNPGRHHPRHERAGDAGDRRLDPAGPRPCRRRRRPRRHRRRGAGIVRALSRLSQELHGAGSPALTAGRCRAPVSRNRQACHEMPFLPPVQ